MVERKRKTELDIEGITAPPKVEAPPPPPPPAPPPPEPAEAELPKEGQLSTRNKIILGAVGAIAVLVIIAVALSFRAKKHSPPKLPEKHEVAKTPPPPAPKKEEESAPVKLNNVVLEPFIFEYKEKNEDRFIRLVFALQMSSAESINEVNHNLPLIRNIIVFFMKTRDKKELLSESARKEILKDLKFTLDRSIQSGRVEAILINELNYY
jgi:flagellar basal body-associated protein FliL